MSVKIQYCDMCEGSLPARDEFLFYSGGRGDKKICLRCVKGDRGLEQYLAAQRRVFGTPSEFVWSNKLAGILCAVAAIFLIVLGFVVLSKPGEASAQNEFILPSESELARMHAEFDIGSPPDMVESFGHEMDRCVAETIRKTLGRVGVLSFTVDEAWGPYKDPDGYISFCYITDTVRGREYCCYWETLQGNCLDSSTVPNKYWFDRVSSHLDPEVRTVEQRRQTRYWDLGFVSSGDSYRY